LRSIERAEEASEEAAAETGGEFAAEASLRAPRRPQEESCGGESGDGELRRRRPADVLAAKEEEGNRARERIILVLSLSQKQESEVSSAREGFAFGGSSETEGAASERLRRGARESEKERKSETQER
jgi:hypothetical protein